MKKKIIAIGLTLALAISVAACGGSDKKEENAKEKTAVAEVNVGETWEVKDQWKITINSVKEVSERSEYEDTKPEAVYSINYTYENLGYENDYSSGLYVSFDSIVDAENEMGYDYSVGTRTYPKEVPVGASMTAEETIGVNHPGNFVIHYSQPDGNGVTRKAKFNCTVE